MVDLPASTWPMKTRSCERGQIGWMSEMDVDSSTILVLSTHSSGA
jgi:hypothetical protein